MKIALNKLLNKSISDSGAIIISALSFLFFGLLVYSISNERLLGEGAKELIGIINSESFFFIHPERSLMFITEILVLIGLKLNADLQTLKILYNFNSLVISLTFYLFFLYKGNYLLGLYFIAAQVIGLGGVFYTHPFMEHVYSIILCIPLISIFKLKNFKLKTLLILVFTYLISSFYPTNFLYIITLLFFSSLSKKEKLFYSAFSFLIMVVLVFITDIPVENKLSSVIQFDLSSKSWLFGIFYKIEVLILVFMTSFLVYKNYSKFYSISLMFFSALPFIFFGYVPEYYFLLPVGMCLLSLICTTLYKRLKVIGVIILVFCISATKIFILGKEFNLAYKSLNKLATLLKDCEKNKLVIFNSEETTQYYEDFKVIGLDEHIRHAVLLISAKTPDQAIWIESFDFNNKHFGETIFKNNANYSKEEFINYLYIENEIKSEPYKSLYEYNGFMFSVCNLNKNYFEISSLGGFKSINYCLSKSP